MRIACGLSAIVLVVMSSTPAPAQFYPGGLLGGRWGGWGGFGTGGRDPGADYLRGIGYYQRAQGDYQVKAAQASELRAEAFAKWNQATSEARKARELREAREQDRRAVETAIRNREGLVEAGILLDQALERIVDFPVEQTHDALAAVPIAPEVLRDIPFENASEPITACLDLMTQEDGWPIVLQQDDFDAPREAFSKAVSQALKEDLSGSISDATRSALDEAMTGLRDALGREEKGLAAFGSEDADQFLRTLAGMLRLLEDPKGGAVYRMIETYEGGTLADLVGFMHAYNLKFGRASTDRQREIYRQLDTLMASIPVAQPGPADVATRPLVESSRLIGDSAREIFSNLSWDDIDKAAGK